MSRRLTNPAAWCFVCAGLLCTGVHGERMFWAERIGDVIGSANRDGSGMSSFAVGDQPYAIAVDALNGHVYWSEGPVGPSGRIRRANLDGSGMQDTVTDVFVTALALDVWRGKIYWTQHNSAEDTSVIRRANLDGTGIENLVIMDHDNFPGGLSLDLDHDKMYWTENLANKVWRANLDGTLVEVVHPVAGGSVLGVAVDPANGKVYWAVCAGSIWWSDLDGSNQEIVVANGTGYECPSGLALDVAAGKLYWTDENGAIRRANLDGTGRQDLITTGLSLPEHLALDNAPEVPTAIPTASTWGLIVLSLCLLAVGTGVLRRRSGRTSVH